MPIYNYTAKDSEGKVVQGTSDASSEEALVSRLRERGYYVQKVSAIEGSGPADETSQPPIERVLEAILHDAVVRNYERAELELVEAEGGQKEVAVCATVGDEHHRVMTVPEYVWKDLLKAIAGKAGAPVPTEGSESGGYFQFEAHGKTVEVSFTASTTYLSLDFVPA